MNSSSCFQKWGKINNFINYLIFSLGEQPEFAKEKVGGAIPKSEPERAKDTSY